MIKMSAFIPALAIIFSSLKGYAYPPRLTEVLSCADKFGSASVSIPNDPTGYPNPAGSTVQKVIIYNETPIRWLLTENTSRVKNLDYLIDRKSPLIPAKVDIDNAPDKAVEVVKLTGIETRTNDAVHSRADDYFGSLYENGNRQVRVTYDHSEKVLTVTLFDTDTNTEGPNWSFRNCVAN
jgi:hypothetical protein